MEELFFLTTMTVLTGYLFTWFGPRLDQLPKPLADYSTIKHFKQALNGRLVISLCEKNKKKFVVRSLVSRQRSLPYKQMKHEISILRVLDGASYSAPSGRTIRVPRIVEIREEGHQLTLVRENIEGVSLTEYSRDIQLSVFSDCLDFFEDLSKRIDKSILKRISKRSNITVPIFFPVYFIIAVVKYPWRILCFINSAFYFFRYIASLSLFATDYVFSHKDLHQGNILVDKSQVGVIDTEIALLSERGTDLAISLVSYWKASDKNDDLVDLLRLKLFSANGRKKFIVLTIYFMIQSIAMNSKSNREDTLRAIDYLEYLNLRLVRILMNEPDTKVL